jgi:ATP-dependent Lon protease
VEYSSFFKMNMVHVHVPSGSTPKDGPSAGITMAASIYSLVTGVKPRSGVAMTGELTLSGKVYPVGGIKEKIIAAKRSNIKEIIIPSENKRDLNEIPAEIRRGLKFHTVSRMDEVISLVFGKSKEKR